MPWLRLIRWSNLLIILLTQLLVWFCVLLPVQKDYEVTLLLTPLNFSLLCISTMLIAAAGYIINDYFDIRIDTINKPDKVILERKIPRRMAIIVHSALNTLALAMAGIVALQAHHTEWLTLQLLCTLILWRYSTTWKRQFMIGNVMVALMTALTVLALLIYEPRLYPFLKEAAISPTGSFGMHPNPVWVIYFFCFFAFTLTWMREIVKDMEDYKGDEEEGCITMPIRWGLKRTNNFLYLLGAVVSTVLILVAALLLLMDDWLMGVYMVLLGMSILIWLRFIGKKFTTRHYSQASRWLKIIMVLGIGTLLLYRFQYDSNYSRFRLAAQASAARSCTYQF